MASHIAKKNIILACLCFWKYLTFLAVKKSICVETGSLLFILMLGRFFFYMLQNDRDTEVSLCNGMDWAITYISLLNTFKPESLSWMTSLNRLQVLYEIFDWRQMSLLATNKKNSAKLKLCPWTQKCEPNHNTKSTNSCHHC